MNGKIAYELQEAQEDYAYADPMSIENIQKRLDQALAEFGVIV
jgi:hypothetical protein